MPAVYSKPCFSELLGKPARALTKACVRETFVINRPDGIGAFKFAVLASLRAAQLCRGCLPRIEGDHCVAVIAQMEIACLAVTGHDGSAPAEAPPLKPTHQRRHRYPRCQSE
jgi:hypothetical protein